MSGNRNCANFCDFGSNRTSNVRVNQGPGGNSSLSLAWDSAPKPPVSNTGRGAVNYGQQQNSYSRPPMNGYNDNSSYQPTNNARNQPSYNNDNNDAAGFKNRGSYNPNEYIQKQKQPSYQDAYDRFQEENSQKPPVYSKKQETSQNNRQSLQIGGDYNYFKDIENNQRPNIPKGNSAAYSNRNSSGSRPTEYQPQNYTAEYQNQYINNNNNNNAGNQRQMNTNNRSSSYNNLENQPRQPNNLHDVKFGYRVNQPPGGRSNIVFG